MAVWFWHIIHNLCQDLNLKSHMLAIKAGEYVQVSTVLLHKCRTSFNELYAMPCNSVFCCLSENSPLDPMIYSMPSCECLLGAKRAA